MKMLLIILIQILIYTDIDQDDLTFNISGVVPNGMILKFNFIMMVQ